MPNRLRAPAQHGELVLSPSDSLSERIAASETSLHQSGTWAAARQAARTEILALATRWTSELVGPGSSPVQSNLWVIGGHQPEMFHPGVWVKNAVIAGLAKRVGGVGLNLIVDNDLCSGSSVRVPVRPDSTGMTSLAWDQPQIQTPWEERLPPHAATLESFGQRCEQHLRPWGIQPLAAAQNWKATPERSIVDHFVRLRCEFERTSGVQNLELKVSDLSDTTAFRRFLWRALQDATAFRDIYNTALQEYRSANHIRSRSHPVPALATLPDGIETPFWVWRAGEHRRSGLYVQLIEPATLRLHDGIREIGRLSVFDESAAMEALHRFRANGWKIRPRALSLTLFCRTMLGSVFVHGIGGAKYDEMTDVLMHRWLGIQPPLIIVSTATLRLFDSFAGPSPEQDILRLNSELRQLRWNPESALLDSEMNSNWGVLRDEKIQLRDRRDLSPATRHAQFQRLNTALRSPLAAREQELHRRLQAQLAQVPFHHALRSREFAAWLFPATEIRELFHRAELKSRKP